MDQPALSPTPPALKGKKKKVDKGKAKRRSSPPHNLFSLLDMLTPPTAHIDKVYKVPRDFYPISTKGWENLGDDNDAGDITLLTPHRMMRLPNCTGPQHFKLWKLACFSPWKLCGCTINEQLPMKINPSANGMKRSSSAGEA